MIDSHRYGAKFGGSALAAMGPWILLMLAAAMFAGHATSTDDFRCPESYPTDAERGAAIKAFVEKFSKENPQKTIDDLVAERHRRLVASDCRQTLIKLKEYGKVEQIAPQVLLPHVRDLTLADHKFERVDDYYDAATHVWNVIFVDDPQHPESYPNQLILNFYGLEPTTEAVASALSEERQGTKNIFLFKSPGEPGGEMVYHIVSLTRRRANFVNLMSVTRWEKSAINISFGHRLSAGSDFNKTEAEASQWLLSAESESIRKATDGLRVGDGWRKYLKQVK